MKGRATRESWPTRFDLCLHFCVCAQNVPNFGLFWIPLAMSD